MPSPTIVWFRHDLRLHDNPALLAAVAREEPILPLFIWAPDEEGDWAPASASRWWLHHSLEALDASLCKLGSRLLLRTGPTLKTLEELIEQTRAGAVYWNRRYEPCAIERDTKIKKQLGDEDLSVESFNSHLLYEPWEIQTRQKSPYQVYTPFWKACTSSSTPNAPEPAPKGLLAPKRWPKSEKLGAFELEPRIDWAEGMRETWTPAKPVRSNEPMRSFAVPSKVTPRTGTDRTGRACR